MRVPAAVRWLAVAVLAAAPAAAQAPGPPAASGAVFQPLLADPKEPQFFAAYLWERSPRLARVRRRRVRLHALARRSEAGPAPWGSRIPPARRAGALRPHGDRPPSGRPGREVVPGPPLGRRLERHHRVRAGRSGGPRRGRLALEPVAAGVHRSRPLR